MPAKKLTWVYMILAFMFDMRSCSALASTGRCKLKKAFCRTMRALPWRTSQTLFLEPSFPWVAFVSALLIPKAVGRKRQAIRPLNLAIR